MCVTDSRSYRTPQYCICMQEIVEVNLPFTASGLEGAYPPAHVQFAI
jgi:hypothetical protein